MIQIEIVVNSKTDVLQLSNKLGSKLKRLIASEKISMDDISTAVLFETLNDAKKRLEKLIIKKSKTKKKTNNANIRLRMRKMRTHSGRNSRNEREA